MADYLYRVTSTRVMCSDGIEANVAVFAYKPYYMGWGNDNDKLNAQLHFKSGATSSDRLANQGKLTGRVVIGRDDRKVAFDAPVRSNPRNLGTFTDGMDDFRDLPIIEGVRPIGKQVDPNLTER